MTAEAELLINLNIPIYDNSGVAQARPSAIRLTKGSKLFVVGANGSGKSALLYHWTKNVPNSKTRIIWAYRKNWMKSSAVNITPGSRLESEKQSGIFQTVQDIRYKDHLPDKIIDNALFDLVESENAFGRSARGAINEIKDGKESLINLKEKYKDKNSPIGKLNNILKQGLFNVEISIGESQKIQASKNGKTFDASQLSDGERNALILSCHILCSPERTVFFIDEPEQHLHRAIGSPLLSALIGERSDCAFVIFTHELSLVETTYEAQILVLHKCYWNDRGPTTWDAKLLQPDEDIPSDVRQAILGGRKRILFVEGTAAQSLDRRLYEVIYPDFTVHPAGGCSEVIQAVKALKQNPNLHWIEAYGIVDRDGRNESEIQNLENENILVLLTVSIESLFYGKETRTFIARNKAKELGENADDLLLQSTSGALRVLSSHADHLVARKCQYQVRQETISNIPSLKNICENQDRTIEISFPSPFAEAKRNFNNLLEASDLDTLISHYPVRESRALNAIAEALHYRSRNDYEAAVVECVKNNEKFRQILKNMLPPIGEEKD